MDQKPEKKYDPKPEISVIIPIYNVAPYLPRCLDSCKKQTMKNVQFVLVDDGSTDGGGEIADQYAREDSRFQVYHTKNNGLSAALNYGLDKAEAEWIMTIDSDDWVDSHFCEAPYYAAKEYDADLVIFNYFDVTEKNKIIKCNKNLNRGIIDVIKAVETGFVNNWNKLYHRCLFEGFRYPEGRDHVDQIATAKMVYKAKRIVSIPDHLYYYQERNGSLSRLKTQENYKTCFLSELERIDFLLEHGFPKERSEPFFFYSATKYISHIWPNKNDELYQKAASILYQMHSAPSEFGWKGKVKLAVWKISPALFHLVFFLAGKKVSSSGDSLKS